MSKKMKVLISVLAAILLLAIGGTAVVMAQEDTDEDSTSTTLEAEPEGLLARVADILDIDEEDLVGAFEQARQEMRAEAFINALDRAVAEGRITQEQADEIADWWEQRPVDEIEEWWGQRPIDEIEEWWGQKPEAIGPNMARRTLRFRAFGCPALRRGREWGGFGGRFWLGPPEPAD